MDTVKEYREKMEAQLEEWEDQIEELKSKASNVAEDKRLEYDEDVERLEEMRDDLVRRLQDLGDTSDDAWRDFKTEVEHKVDDFKNSLQKLSGKMTE